MAGHSVGEGAPLAPVARSERIEAIDILRGLALFGVLAINLETAFRVSIFQQFVPHPDPTGLNRIVDAALGLFVDMKAFALFSLLFGAGLAIQFDRMPPAARAVLLVRRLLALLAFGACHILFLWEGDVLAEYAVAGLLVLPFLFGPTALMGAACLALLAFYVAMPYLPPLPSGRFPPSSWLAEQVRTANAVYPNGSYAEVMKARLAGLPGVLVLHVQILPRTLGLFLLGALSWRLRLFRDPVRLRRILPVAAGPLIGAGLIASAITALRSATAAGEILLALGYAALVLGACAGRGVRFLAWAAPLGRMAFTNYILQTVVLGFIFYGYGLRLFGKLDLVSGLAITIAVYAAQAMTSRLWLAVFRFGPLEWLWRVLTYGRLLRLRRDTHPA